VFCQCTHQGGDWGPCVVRGLVDGRFLVWWVIDNVEWTNSWNPSSFVFSFSSLFSSSFLGLAWELHVRSRERDGWSGVKIDLLWTFMVCIDDSAWFLKSLCCLSCPPFLVIFGALCCDFCGGVLRTSSCEILLRCHVWGPCASLVGHFAPRIHLKWTRFAGFPCCSSSCPRETISSIPLDCERFESIPLR
jgi:hypothetical protein